MNCVSTPICFNMKRGYCGWAECPHSHNVFSEVMGNSVYNLIKHCAVWVNLGKSRNIPAKFEYLTKVQLVERRNKLRQESKVQELVLSSDSESEEDEEEDDCF